LAIGVADKLAMMRYSVFSVISPEGCAAILWNDPAKVEQATKALKITPDELLKMELVDDIIDEPLTGAHRDKEGAAKAVGDYFLSQVKSLKELDKCERIKLRYERMMNFGSFTEAKD